MRGKKKIYTIDELLSSDDFKKSKKELDSKRYKKSLSAASSDEYLEDEIKRKSKKTGKFSLRTRILNNPWLKDRPTSQALKWLYTEVFKDAKKYKWKHALLLQGNLFAFRYMNPKWKDKLAFWDNFPLVIALKPITTNSGLLNRGFNLHLIPIRVRILTLCYIFNIYKNIYRYGFINKNPKQPVGVEYRVIMKVLQPFGVGFCIRSYIPQRQKEIVHFPLTDWHKAIFLASRGYEKVKAQELLQLFLQYCKDNGISVNPKLDWKAMI
jgi:hypothetical protein